MAIKNAKTIAEYAIRKYLQEQNFDTKYCTLEMSGHECTLTDQNGDSLVLVYDPDKKTVYIKGFEEG